MTINGNESGPSAPQWVEMIGSKTRAMLEHPEDLIIPNILKQTYDISPTTLPLREAADILPHITRLQKIRHQDHSIYVLPSLNGFSLAGAANFGGDVNIFGSGASSPLEVPPNIDQGDNMDVRWLSWFAMIGQHFWGRRSQTSTIGSDAMNTPFILVGVIPEKKRIAMLVPAFNLHDSRYPGRSRAATLLIDFDSESGIGSFREQLNKSGTNLLNALFGELLVPSLTPTITKFQETNFPVVRNEIFAAKPTTQVYLREVSSAKNQSVVNKQLSPTHMVNILAQAQQEREAKK